MLETDLVGKTIIAIENDCINVLKLKFSDGTEVDLWADTIPIPSGELAGIYIDEDI